MHFHAGNRYYGCLTERKVKASEPKWQRIGILPAPKHPYTQALISAVPVVDPQSRRQRIVLPGDAPSPMDPPAGCPFHPRCPLAEARCRVEPPQFRELAPGHWVACHLAK